MEIKNSFDLLKNKFKYHLNFLRHTKNESNHVVTNEDKRLRKVILENYFKSLTFVNLFALYLNYIRRNKTYTKTILSKYRFKNLFFIE
jgi:hypothetical protein